MLKKLVKYGNSNALVLDKPLLELLNIGENAVVKIKTDGRSLIITPQTVAENESITKTITPSETLQEAVTQVVGQACINSQDASIYMSDMRKVLDNYRVALKKLEEPEAQYAIQELQNRFNNNTCDPEYIKELSLIRHKYIPQLSSLEQEIKTISKKYEQEPYYSSDTRNIDNLANSVERFEKVHKKYSHITQAIVQLNEKPEYINELVLLAEKYQFTKNSREYIQEHAQIITKYIPEYCNYQNEIKEVAESFFSNKI